MTVIALSVLVLSSYGWLSLVRALGGGTGRHVGARDATNARGSIATPVATQAAEAARTGQLHARDDSSIAGSVAASDRLHGGGGYRNMADGAWRMSVLVPWLRLASKVQVVVVLKNATTGEVLVDDRGGPLVIRQLGRHRVRRHNPQLTPAHTRNMHKLSVLKITTTATAAAAAAAHLHAPNRRRRRRRPPARHRLYRSCWTL